MNKIFAFSLVLVSQVAFAAFPIVAETTVFTPEDVENTFNIGGFLLGLILGIYGVIIAYLIKEKNVIKSSWWGFGIRTAIALALVLLLMYYSGEPIFY